MPRTITLEVTSDAQEQLLRQAHAFLIEMDSLALRAPDGQVLDLLEDLAVEGGRKLTLAALEVAAQKRIDDAEKKGSGLRSCPCGRARENRSKATRSLMTSVGSIGLTRRWWKCRNGDEDGGYLADRSLGIEGGFSRPLQRQICLLGADLSFAKAQRWLRELKGLSVGEESIRLCSERHGAEMATRQPTDRATTERFARSEGDVEFFVDAGKVNTREAGWKDLKIASFQRRPRAKAAEPEAWCDRELPGATIRVAFASIARAKRFRRPWRQWAGRLGVRRVGSIHALGDGAAWIWRSVEAALGKCRETLDVYHALEHIAAAGQELYGGGSAESEGFLEKGREYLVGEGWAGVMKLAGETLSGPEAEARRPAVEKLMNYFAKPIGRLDYAGDLAEGRSIGSGPIEGWAKTLGLRMKSRGARWNRRNVGPMAALVCIQATDQWDSYWKVA